MKVTALEPAANAVELHSVQKIFCRSGFLFWRSRKIETHALRGISLTVGRGEVLGLLGPNGSGKSTTLKLVSSLLLPDRGRVLVNGCDTREHGPAVRRSVGFALTNDRSFFPRLTARENLEFFAALENVPRTEVQDRIASALYTVELGHAARKEAVKLSSGMHQRLGIARALVKDPSVLLLDEPTRSLDPAAASELWNIIRRIANAGAAVLLATHNFEEAVSACDRVAFLRRGELAGEQNVWSLTREQLRESYFEISGKIPRSAWEVPA